MHDADALPALAPPGPSTLEAAAPPTLMSAVVAERIDEHPAAVYLARLAPSGRRSQRCALATIAGLLTDGRAGVLELPWHRLRYAHTQAVRTALAEVYAPATVNRQLSALRGVLAECWRLGLMTADEYHRAVDLPAVRGSSLPAGRALTGGALLGVGVVERFDHRRPAPPASSAWGPCRGWTPSTWSTARSPCPPS